MSVLLAARTAHDVARLAARPYTSHSAYLLAERGAWLGQQAGGCVHKLQTMAPVPLHAHLAAASRMAALRSGPSCVKNGLISTRLSVFRA